MILGNIDRIKISLSLLLALMIGVGACKKVNHAIAESEDDETSLVLTIPPGADSLLYQIVDDLSRKEKRKPFLRKLVQYQGKPAWTKSMVLSDKFGDGKTTVFIPLLLDTTSRKSVHAILVAKKDGNKFTYRLLQSGDYKKINSKDYPSAPSAENLLGIYFNLEKRVFGHRSFNITDENLFTQARLKLKRKGVDESAPFQVTLSNGKKNAPPAGGEIGQSIFVEIIICEVVWVPGPWLTEGDTYQLSEIETCNYSMIYVPDNWPSGGGGEWGEGISYVRDISGGSGGGGSGGGGDGDDGEGNGYEPIPNPKLTTITNLLNLSLTEVEWLGANNNLLLLDELYDILVENNFGYESIQALDATITLLHNDLLYSSFTEQWQYIKFYVNNSATVTNVDPLLRWLTMRCIVIRFEHPEWSSVRVYWAAIKDLIHFGLDGLGFVPVVGEVADLINGAIYTIEGEGINAALSYSASIPFAGWFATTAKWAKKTIDLTGGAKTTLVWLKKAGNLIDFGDRGQLRKILNLATGNPLVAHHILPWALREHDLIQKAAKGGTPFHMNEVLNGLPITVFQHNSGHPGYISKVSAKLDELWLQFGSDAMSPETARSVLESLIGQLKSLIQNNSTVKLDELIF